MKKSNKSLAKQYVCQSCGHVQPKWGGQCPSCQGWNTLQEEIMASRPQGSLSQTAAGEETLALYDFATHFSTVPLHRIQTGMSEFDRVCGGGIVPGSVILLGGDPGIGKSTLLLHLMKALKGQKCLYVSGEEGVEQIYLRAHRIGLDGASADHFHLACNTDLERILATLEKDPSYRVVVIDSIQTIFTASLEAAPGTVSQVRACSHELIQLAKTLNIAIVLVGHVTKEGLLAGPRVLEHMVDAVFYFEGEKGHTLRILRAVKNRFGGTDEIGVFEMAESGLREVPNPSALFVTDREKPLSGSVIFVRMEGTRPLLAEIQALVVQTNFIPARRAVVGWDTNRLAMILAVLEKRCGLFFGNQEVYLNVAGGFRIQETAADLAVAGAIISAAFDIPFPAPTILFGEMSLAGEIRPVRMTENRLKEAHRLGFQQIIMPYTKELTRTTPALKELQLRELQTIGDLLSLFPKAKRPSRPD